MRTPICFFIFLILLFRGYKTRSNEISFHGSSSYIEIGKPFTCVCSSDVSPTAERAKFLLNQNAYISLRYITNLSACYAISPTNVPPPYICTDTCSCTPSNFTLTYTSNASGNNYVILFGCEMIFNLTVISKTLTVPVAHGPLSVDLNSPSHVWITESEPLSPIQCTADCVPNCTYTWNGPRRTFNGSILEFSSVQKSQNGTYTCTASNIYGSNITTVNILVQYAPLEITINPVNTSYDVVEAYQLGPVSCNATCYPECEIQWTGPGYNVTSYRLVIDNITRDQSGIFTCTAKNRVGSLTKKLQVKVLYGPSIVSLFPHSSNVIVNASGQLGPINCSSDCEPQCLYRWNGPEFNQSTSSLLIRDIQSNQNGTYICIASNKYGQNTANVNVFVHYAPLEITINPVNTSYDVVEAFQLGPISCNATCYPECEIQWTGPGYNIASYRLVIDTITRNQRGIFTCTAKNRVGSLTKGIQVNVLYGPSIVSLSPSMANVSVNESGQLGPIKCSSDCEPQCLYRWIGPGFNQSTSSLLIRDTRRFQNGTYKCIASNKYGQNTTDVNVFVHFGPNFPILQPNISSYTINETMSLGPINCSSFCYPTCTYTWTGPGHFQTTSNQLYIARISRNQSGTFECEAKNSVAYEKQTIGIIVQYAPIIQEFHISNNKSFADENSTITMSCTAEGNPKPKLSWMFINTSGIKVTLQTKEMNLNSYRIDNAKCTHTGRYSCQADNEYFPISNASEYLNITCSPKVKSECSTKNPIAIKKDTITVISACFISNPAPMVYWHLINGSTDLANATREFPIMRNSSIMYTSVLQTSLTRTNEKRYQVVATNSLGNSSSYEFIIVLQDKPYIPIDVGIFCNDKNEINWTSNFNGGKEQSFQIRFKEMNTTKVKTGDIIEDPGRGQRISRIITGLLPGKVYIFTVIANNSFGDTESDSVTCVTKKKTQSLESDSLKIIGTATGSASAAMVFLAVVAIYMWRRSHRSDKDSNMELLRNRSNETDINLISENEDGLKDNILYITSGEVVNSSGQIICEENKDVDVYTEINKTKKKTQHQDVYENYEIKGTDTKASKPKDNLSKRKNADGLVYVDLVFKDIPNERKFIIRGIEDRTQYVEVDFSQKADPLPSDSSDEEEQK